MLYNILPQTGQHCPGGTIVPTPGGQIGRAQETPYKYTNDIIITFYDSNSCINDIAM